jgi:Ala-tRNA(Pro) deacylase
MNTLRRCLDMLDRYGIPHVHTTHGNAYRAREVAEAEHLPAYMLAKTVLVQTPYGYAMAVLPADCKVDLDELAKAISSDPVRLATEEEVRERFPDCEVGAFPPFGPLFRLPVYMDTRLADETFIFFNAGTHRDAIHMSVADYIRLADPVVTRFAHPDKLLPTMGSITGS